MLFDSVFGDLKAWKFTPYKSYLFLNMYDLISVFFILNKLVMRFLELKCVGTTANLITLAAKRIQFS